MARAAFLYSDDLASFDYGDDHPFKPLRARNALELCHRYGLMDDPSVLRVEPVPATRQDLEFFHEPEYLDALRTVSLGHTHNLDMLARGLGTADCPLLRGVYEFNLLAAGATLQACRMVLDGTGTRAFNPVGGFHHAGPGRAEGFCYLNDVAVALTWLVSRGHRVAFVDLDAHHGNGVQDAFYDSDRALVISLHESGTTLYPWGGPETEIGTGRGRGYNVNVPLAEKTDDETYLRAFRRIVPPLLDAFRPDLVLAEIGADTVISDPLTHLRLTNNGYGSVVRELCDHAPRLAAVGGGGYDVYRSARCWTLAWSAITGIEPEDDHAGLVGGAMYGAEMESLYDRPFPTKGEPKERALAQVDRVADFLERSVFPLVRGKKP